MYKHDSKDYPLQLTNKLYCIGSINLSSSVQLQQYTLCLICVKLEHACEKDQYLEQTYLSGSFGNEKKESPGLSLRQLLHPAAEQ